MPPPPKKSRYASVERTSTGRISTPGLGRSCRLLLRPALLLLGDCEEYEDVAAPPPLDCSAGPVASSRSPVLPGSFAIKSVYCVSDFVVLTKEHGREEQRIRLRIQMFFFFGQGTGTQINRHMCCAQQYKAGLIPPLSANRGVGVM